MARVLGIGGVFFKTQDPKALRAWYVRVLKLELKDWGGAVFPPLPKGRTAWNAFPAGTDYFRPSTAPYMVNFVVDDLDGMVAHIKSEGVEVLDRQEMAGMGRFAWVVDPAGTKIELWQPA